MVSSFGKPCRALSDAEERCSQHEQFNACIGKFRQELVAYFMRRLPCPEEAEDLAHEVLIRVLRCPDLEGIVAIRPYIFEVAKNAMIDRGRRGRARCESSHEPLSEMIPDEDHAECERTIMARQDIECVRSGLLELPDRTRSIFILRRLEGMRHQEIAGNLGVSLSTVEKHVRLAMLHLKGRLESRA